MQQIIRALAVASSIFMSNAFGQVNVISPETISWRGSPLTPGNEIGPIVGAASKPGLYIFRVKMAAGSRIPPHTHPDERHTTVLNGTIWMGVGETFDENTMVIAPTGAVFVVPANVAHYVWAKEGEAIFQESGIGPSATVPIKR